MLWLGLILSLFGVYCDSTDSIIGAAAGYMSLWSVYQLFKLATGKEGMGYGDFKLLAMLGAWLGWQSLPAIIVLSSLVGSVVGITIIVAKKYSYETPIPFGPYQIAHALVAPGQPALKQLTACFGDQILNQDNSLNRSALRNLVFSDPEQRLKLNAIMHPLVYAEIERQITLLQSPYCIIAVPLLLETGQADRVDRILVVDCDTPTQIQRVIARDQLKIEQIQAIIDSQMPRSQRLALADDIIDNSSTSDQLAEAVKRLHNSYHFLATVRTSSA